MKHIIALSCFSILLLACNNLSTPKQGDTNSVENVRKTELKQKLPFVGIREFETRPGTSGTGTPHKSIEITKDGDVIFSFEQENQSDNTITSEKYNAGKYNKYMKCVFKKLDNLITHYEIIDTYIYEVDEHGQRLKSEDCCHIGDELNKNGCNCVGELSKVE